MSTAELLQEIRQTVDPVLEAQGLELVDLEYRREGRGFVLRLYVDRPGGVTVDECAEASSEIGVVLEGRDLIPNPYILEVSSPGLTRPLKKAEDFDRYRDRMVKVKTFEPIEDRRNFKGVLRGREGEMVLLEAEGRIYRIPFQRIAKANLEIEF